MIREYVASDGWTAIETRGAAQLFNVAMYGRLAKRLLKEAETMTFEPGKEYSSEDLRRYCAFRNMSLMGLGYGLKRGHAHYRFLKADGFVFKLDRIDGEKYHHWYKLTEQGATGQTSLF